MKFETFKSMKVGKGQSKVHKALVAQAESILSTDETADFSFERQTFDIPKEWEDGTEVTITGEPRFVTAWTNPATGLLSPFPVIPVIDDNDNEREIGLDLVKFMKSTLKVDSNAEVTVYVNKKDVKRASLAQD